MKLMLTFYKLVRKATDGKHTPPGMTAVNRLVLVCLVLGLGGAPILGHALATVPAGVVIIVGMGLALRVGLWFWRRRR
jgi:hypothetical protein